MEENNNNNSYNNPDDFNSAVQLNKSPGDVTLGKGDSNGDVELLKDKETKNLYKEEKKSDKSSKESRRSLRRNAD